MKKRKNCSGTKGYNCGSSCISVKKECRKDGLSGQSVSIATKMTEAIKQASEKPYSIPDKFSTNLTKIGEGFFGEVFLDNKNPDVVIKYDKREIFGDAKRNEIDNQKVAADLGLAPKILAEEEKAVAMEFKKGAALDYNNKEQIDEAIRSIRKLQKAGIAHNDTHNENVIVGEDGKITLLDFGLSKRGPEAVEKEALESFTFSFLLNRSSFSKAIKFKRDNIYSTDEMSAKKRAKLTSQLFDLIDSAN